MKNLMYCWLVFAGGDLFANSANLSAQDRRACAENLISESTQIEKIANNWLVDKDSDLHIGENYRLLLKRASKLNAKNLTQIHEVAQTQGDPQEIMRALRLSYGKWHEVVSDQQILASAENNFVRSLYKIEGVLLESRSTYLGYFEACGDLFDPAAGEIPSHIDKWLKTLADLRVVVVASSSKRRQAYDYAISATHEILRRRYKARQNGEINEVVAALKEYQRAGRLHEEVAIWAITFGLIHSAGRGEYAHYLQRDPAVRNIKIDLVKGYELREKLLTLNVSPALMADYRRDLDRTIDMLEREMKRLEALSWQEILEQQKGFLQFTLDGVSDEVCLKGVREVLKKTELVETEKAYHQNNPAVRKALKVCRDSF